MAADYLPWVLAAVTRELTAFAAIGFLVGGIDELAVDLIWLARWARRRLPPYYDRVDAATIAPPVRPGRIAVFIPAWDESAVIGQMLSNTVRRFAGADLRLYVGCYPNDPATIAIVRAAAATAPMIRFVLGALPGPTTKADCLNTLWRALLADEVVDGCEVKAVVLHDAEDVVHWAEPRIFDRLVERFDLVQLPVLPLLDPGSRWVAGHYADAFAEAHGKTLPVREAIGAALPAAGVGCAFSRAMLGRIAEAQGGLPFDARSLTEDYELGLKVRELGGRSAFVRLPGSGMTAVVAVREHFPATAAEAVRQKARWMAGIALDGWDRLGWRGGLAERWMRLRDRRAPLAMLVLAAGYAALLLWAAGWLLGLPALAVGDWLSVVLWTNAALLGWRMMVRYGFVAQAYGWRQGVMAIPRMIVGNVIDMRAARCAVLLHLRGRAGGTARWDKTAHRFPDNAMLE